MFSLVKMSGKWYGQEIDDIAAGQDNMQEHVNCGNIVVLADDKECFADEMGIDEDEIIMVD